MTINQLIVETEQKKQDIIDMINSIDNSNYIGKHRIEELDYDLGQIEMYLSELYELYDKN